VNFEEYLHTKKIDARAFSQTEAELFNVWKNEFEQMHPNSFTVQKLNLINPIRRKYQLREVIPTTVEKGVGPEAPASASPKPGKPIIKPKPKFN
jgi:hypothetical protein